MPHHANQKRGGHRIRHGSRETAAFFAPKTLFPKLFLKSGQSSGAALFGDEIFKIW